MASIDPKPRDLKLLTKVEEVKCGVGPVFFFLVFGFWVWVGHRRFQALEAIMFRLATPLRSNARLLLNRNHRLSTASAESAMVENSAAYDGAVQAMHWASGISVLGTFAFVQLAQNTKDKKAKMSYMCKSFMH